MEIGSLEMAGVRSRTWLGLFFCLILAFFSWSCSSRTATSPSETAISGRQAFEKTDASSQGEGNTVGGPRRSTPARESTSEQGGSDRASHSTRVGDHSARGGEKPEGKEWRAADGSVLAVGEFIDLLEDQVCILKPDGTGITVAFHRLCAEDQNLVRQLVADRQKVEGSSSAEEASDEIVFEDDLVIEGDGEEARAGLSGSEAAGQRKTSPDQSADPRKFVIPFDFVSQFDNGRYGQMVGELIWKKLQREGGFLLPESMLEVRDFCAAHQIAITPETPLEEVRHVVRDLFDGHIAIWGSVERAPGAMWDVYDLHIKCVDFSEENPRVIFDLTARTNTVSEIPHLYVEQLLDKLYDRQPRGPRPPDPIAEENWVKNPNLVVGGDFEQGRGGVPLGWEPGGGQHREPLGRLVKWIPEPGSPNNKIIRFEFGADVGDSYGVMYYSEPFPVEEGATYRFQCRWRSNGPAVKVFIKCYDLMESEYQPASALAGKGSDSARYVPNERQLREVYRSQQNLKGPLNQWNTHTQDFTPRHTKYTPRWGKVMLYAYLGAGIVDFDDIVVKQILPPSPSERQKELRHSLASPVTLKEMEENVRRGQEARERLRARDPSK